MAQKFTVPITVKQLASAGSDAVTVYVDADTYARLKLEAGGRLVWGSGSATGDVTLYRESADVLKTDDAFKVGGLFTVTASSGDEGGEINLAKPATNSTISGNVAIDIYQNKIRIFETGGSNRGAYIDLTSANTGVGSNLLSSGGGATTLDGLTDVTAPTPASGDFLKWNGTAWVNDPINLGTDTTGNYMLDVSAGTGVSVSHTQGEGSTATVSLNATLDNLSNVTVPSPTTGDLIQWNGTAWVNVASSTVGATNLDGLSDVVITSPAQYQTLSYDGSTWVNDFPTTVSLVQNAEATTLQVGEAVYLFGGTGSHASVKRAGNGGDSTSAKTVGLVGKAIAAGATGPVVTRGYVFGMDLSTGYTVGQTLYLGTNGGVTTTKPYAPAHLVYIGVVVRATNNGIIYVAAQNGYELDEIHDVDLITTPPTSGDFLKYNGTLWVNDKIDLGTDTNGNYVQNLVAGTGITLTNGTASEGGTPTIAVTANTYQPLDGDLTAIAGLAGTSGVLKKTAADTWALDTSTFVTTSDTGSVTSAMIADGTIVNGDISSTAAIAHSKLANATPGQVLLGTTTTGVVTATTVSGDVTITGAGVTAIGSGVIVDSDISASAAIDKTKISGTAITAADTGTVTSTMIANGTIVDADINSAAAISLSKLSTTGASTGNVITYNGSTWTAASVASGGASVTISDTPPSSPTNGNLWFESDTTRTYIRYNSAWVEVGSIPTIQYLNDIGDVQAATPTTGQVLQWNGTYWVPAVAAGGGLNTTTDGAIITMAIGA